MLEGLGDVSGCDEEDVDALSSLLLEESVAADAAVEVESDRAFLLLLLDAVMIDVQSTRYTCLYCRNLYHAIDRVINTCHHLDSSCEFEVRGSSLLVGDGIRKKEKEK